MRLTFSDADMKKPCVLALGMFDGVHTGHAWLLRTAREWGDLEGLPVVVCTFLQHPLALLRPQSAPPMLSTIAERAERMAQLKVDALVALPFDEKTMDMSPKKYVARLVKRFSPKHVVVGFNYSFGRGGEGDPKLLKKLGKKHGFEVHVVSPVQVDDQIVSSTRVRELLAQGEMELVTRLMERPYAIAGRVERGKGLGRVMGFPTANVAIPQNKALPKYGIYAAEAALENGVFPAVVSLGIHPTVPGGGVLLEAHLLDRKEDLYGQKVRVAFYKRLREEVKFSGLQELKEQIARDVQNTKEYFGLP